MGSSRLQRRLEIRILAGFNAVHADADTAEALVLSFVVAPVLSLSKHEESSH
jgi:hypothetical protein